MKACIRWVWDMWLLFFDAGRYVRNRRAANQELEEKIKKIEEEIETLLNYMKGEHK